MYFAESASFMIFYIKCPKEVWLAFIIVTSILLLVALGLLVHLLVFHIKLCKYCRNICMVLLLWRPFKVKSRTKTIVLKDLFHKEYSRKAFHVTIAKESTMQCIVTNTEKVTCSFIMSRFQILVDIWIHRKIAQGRRGKSKRKGDWRREERKEH